MSSTANDDWPAEHHRRSRHRTRGRRRLRLLGALLVGYAIRRAWRRLIR